MGGTSVGKVLVVCCDGTWNTPDQQGRPTNVTKFARALCPRAPDGSAQLVYYDEGVGRAIASTGFWAGPLASGSAPTCNRPIASWR